MNFFDWSGLQLLTLYLNLTRKEDPLIELEAELIEALHYLYSMYDATQLYSHMQSIRPGKVDSLFPISAQFC